MTERDLSLVEKQLRMRKWLVAGGVILAVSAFGAARRVADETSAPSNSAANEATIQTMVSRQDSGGIKETDFSPLFLSNLESYSQERVAAAAQKFWERDAVPLELRVVKAEGAYVEVNGRKFAVIRFRMMGATPQAMIFGVQGKDLVKVVCLASEPVDVSVTSGPCNEKVLETFGVSLSPMRN